MVDNLLDLEANLMIELCDFPEASTNRVYSFFGMSLIKHHANKVLCGGPDTFFNLNEDIS